MARISLRLEDGLHDQLLRQARRYNITLSDLVRPTLERLAYPGRVSDAASQHAQLGIMACTLSLLLLDIEARAPHLLEPGTRAARDLFRGWGLPEELVGHILAGLEHRHGA